MNKINKNLRLIQIICAIYIILIFTIAVLQKYSIINVNFSLIPFYVISTIIILITISILLIKIDKEPHSKKLIIIVILSMIGLAILMFFAILIDYRTDSIKFRKHATKIDATIYRIDKNTKFIPEQCSAGTRQIGSKCYYYGKDDYVPASREYYELYYTYYLKYEINNTIYLSTYKEKEYKHFYNEEIALNYKTKYKENDYMTIYYDNNNPQIIRKYVKDNYGIETYITGIVVIIFQIFYFLILQFFINNKTLELSKM